jgi:ABC-type transport system involved in cytochrome c biogenesis permease component
MSAARDSNQLGDIGLPHQDSMGRRFVRRHIIRLVLLELQRARTGTVRMVSAAAMVALLCVLLGRTDQALMLPVAFGFALGAVLTPAALMLRDRLEGTLESLQRLPTSPDNIALAKLLAAAILMLPGALQAGLTIAWLSYGRAWRVTSLDPFVLGVSTLAIAWIVLSTLAQLAVAMMARFDPERSGVVPPLIAAGLLLLGPAVINRLFPRPLQTISWLLAQAWTPPLFLLSALALCAGISLVSFHIVRGVVERYDPAIASVQPT